MLPPQVVSMESSFSKFVLSNVKSIKAGYQEPPTIKLLGPNIHFIMSAIFLPRIISRKGIRFNRELLSTENGSLVAIDWIVHPFIPSNAKFDDDGNEERIVMIICDTFEQTFSHLHLVIQGMEHFAHKMFIFTPRGTRGVPLATPYLPSYSDSSDLRQVIDFVLSKDHISGFRKCKKVRTKISCVAFSTGADLLLAYLGEFGSSSYIDSAVCISPLFQPKIILETHRELQINQDKTTAFVENRKSENSSAFVSKVKLLLHRIFLLQHFYCLKQLNLQIVLFEQNSLKCLFSECSSAQHTKQQHEEKRDKKRGILEMKERKGFEDADGSLRGDFEKDGEDKNRDRDYWDQNDPLRDVDDISTPVLFIKAKDDPLVPDSVVPFDIFQSYPNLILLTTESGSHSGFISSLNSHSFSSWAEEVAIEFLVACWNFEQRQRKCHPQNFMPSII